MCGRSTGRVLITLLGWLAVIGGAVRIIVPAGHRRRSAEISWRAGDCLDHRRVIWLAIGVVLCFFGYVW